MVEGMASECNTNDAAVLGFKLKPTQTYRAIVAMDGASIAALYLDFSRTHKVLNREEARTSAKLCEIGKAFMQEKARALVRGAGGRAILHTYGSDCTPLLTGVSYTTQLQGGRVVVRKGSEGAEFLVQRSFLKTTDASGDPVQTVLFTEPVPLTQGKSAWCQFTAAQRFFPMLRALGHKGVSVSHYCFDRMMQSSLNRKMQQRQGLYYEVVGGESPRTGPAALHELLDWHLSTGCAAHDSHNSLKWGLECVTRDTGNIVRKLHVTIESLRNAFDLLHGFLKPFVEAKLAFEGSPENPQEVYDHWVNLGVVPDIAETLAELNLHWDGSKLLVGEQHRGRHDLVQKVSACMLGVFQFRTFTTSRWITVGDSSRSLVASLCLGLQGLVHMIRQSPDTSEYYIHGFGQLDNETLKYAIVAAMSSNVSDAVLVELLEDDRLARHVAAIERGLQEECQWIADVSGFTWNRLSGLLSGLPAKALRSACCLAASISAAYFTRKCLQVVQSFPWKLCVGNIADNLEQLASQIQCPSADATTQQIHHLLRIGYSRRALVEGILLLRDVHFATNNIEQGHGSAATIIRAHKRYGKNMLSQRSFIHMMRFMFPSSSAESGVSKSRSEAKLESLMAYQPQRITGRHIFLGDLQTALATAVPLERRGEVGQTMMVRHALVYKGLKPALREEYEARAANMSSARRKANDDELATLLRQRQDSGHIRSRQDPGDPAQLQVSTCRLSETDLATIAAMYSSFEFSERKVEALREQAIVGPPPPTAASIAKLEAIAHDAEEVGALPDWCHMVCKFRNEFHGCALVFQTDGAEATYLLLFAQKSPQQAAFIPLTKKEFVLPLASSLEGPILLATMATLCEHQFECQWCHFVYERDIVINDATIVHVLPDMRFLHSNVVGSNRDLLPLSDFIEDFGLPGPGPPKAKKAKVDLDAQMNLVQQFPWLEAYGLKGPAPARESLGNQAAGSSGDLLPIADATPLMEDEQASTFAALQARRESWEGEHGQPAQNFKTMIHGGKWTAATQRVPFDSIKTYAQRGEPYEWCKRYSLSVAASFSFKKFGDRAASSLALYWCQRMQYFYTLYLMAGQKDYHFTAEDRNQAPEPDAQLFGTLFDAKGVVAARLSELEGVFPASFSSQSASSR